MKGFPRCNTKSMSYKKRNKERQRVRRRNWISPQGNTCLLQKTMSRKEDDNIHDEKTYLNFLLIRASYQNM